MDSYTTGKKLHLTRRRVLGVAGLSLMGLAGAGGILFYNWWQNDHLHPAVIYQGHANYVPSIAWSPDSKHIASGDGNGIVQIWERDTGNTLSTYQSHAGVVEAIAWSPDGRHIASAHGNADHVHVWEATTGHNILTYQGHSAILEVLSWAPDSKRIASGSYDGTIQVWDSISGSNFDNNPRQTQLGIVEDIAWSPDGKHIASLTEYDGLDVRNANTGSPVLNLQEYTGVLDKLAWSPDGRYICVFSDVDMGASNPGALTGRVWDISTGKVIFTSPTQASCGLQDVTWSPDGKRIVFTDSCSIWIWDIARGGHLWTSPQLASGRELFFDGYTMAFSPDGRYLAGGDRNPVLIWKVPQL
ncbi:hypothetical protein KSC_106950 [Ktedonobacter sp. SOSP1-52]|uniref:WD40 repeat domain-containing protein n=1 Tax=Ktedonobacter sp. SOSP1-52 TaxID=2778366 RepID=UPI001915FDEA|nr:DPP IV N-terminal domain-containing protein [Ktedonobacter sp. SOSP1-52]GHO71803.1 hypothetical protein KSC_106950 [Ktedonobacter sp. SOSP1-52]